MANGNIQEKINEIEKELAVVKNTQEHLEEDLKEIKQRCNVVETKADKADQKVDDLALKTAQDMIKPNNNEPQKIGISKEVIAIIITGVITIIGYLILDLIKII